jgi:hypothetical protein
VRIALENGRTVNEPATDNYFYSGFVKNIYLRPSCYVCPTKKGRLVADITIGDFWQLFKYQPQLVNHGGTSAIIVNSQKGRSVVEDCGRRLSLTQCPFTYLLNDGKLRKCVGWHPSREAFFADLDRLSFDDLARRYMNRRGAAIRYLVRVRRFYLGLVNRLRCRFEKRVS